MGFSVKRRRSLAEKPQRPEWSSFKSVRTHRKVALVTAFLEAADRPKPIAGDNSPSHRQSGTRPRNGVLGKDVRVGGSNLAVAWNRFVYRLCGPPRQAAKGR